MAEQEQDRLIDEYLRRAMERSQPSTTVPRRQPSSPATMNDETPRVFGGNLEPPGGGPNSTTTTQPKNRAFAKRRYSTFNLILVLIATAVASVLYIGNIIRVGELANEVAKLQNTHQRNINEQEMLRSQINRMSSLDRIRKLAETDLGMVNPKQPPVWLDLDHVRIQEIDEAILEKKANSRVKR